MEEIRGERRKKTRSTKDRRERARTPGRFDDAVSAVYKVERSKQACPQCGQIGFHKMDCSDPTKWSYSDNGGFEKV